MSWLRLNQSPLTQKLTADIENSISITGFMYTPLNFKSLKSNHFFTQFDYKNHLFLSDANNLGDHKYSENQVYLNYKTPLNSRYRTILAVNYYQVRFENYGTANLLTADIGLFFQLKSTLNTTILFQNIMKRTKL